MGLWQNICVYITFNSFFFAWPVKLCSLWSNKKGSVNYQVHVLYYCSSSYEWANHKSPITYFRFPCVRTNHIYLINEICYFFLSYKNIVSDLEWKQYYNIRISFVVCYIHIFIVFRWSKRFCYIEFQCFYFVSIFASMVQIKAQSIPPMNSSLSFSSPEKNNYLWFIPHRHDHTFNHYLLKIPKIPISGNI